MTHCDSGDPSAALEEEEKEKGDNDDEDDKDVDVDVSVAAAASLQSVLQKGDGKAWSGLSSLTALE